MASFFPRVTTELRLVEDRIHAFRRMSYNLAEMALITGVVMRLYRSVALTHGSNDWLYIGGTFAVGIVFLCGMATLHLANYPLYRWAWRAPVFAAVEAAGEMVVSFVLIWVGREPAGTGRAEMHDLWSLAWSALWTRGITICLWALLLAGIVAIARRYIPSDDPQ
jgi:hypothetical protein